MPSTTATAFRKITARIIEAGNAFDPHSGVNPLASVNQQTIKNVLQEALDKNAGYFWAVLAVLMRMRFGDFVFLTPSSPLMRIKNDALDDVEVSVLGFRKFVLQPYQSTIAAFGNLFEKEKKTRMRSEIYQAFLDVGFFDRTIIKMIAFLRDVQVELPREIGQDVELREVMEMLLPILEEAFPYATHSFFTGDEDTTLLRVVDGNVGSEVYVSRNSAVKGNIEGTNVVLGQTGEDGEVCFGAIIAHYEFKSDALRTLKKLQAPPKTESSVPTEKKKTAPASEPKAVKQTAIAIVGTNQDLLVELAKNVDELCVRMAQSRATLEKAETAMVLIEAAQAEELERHQAVMENLQGQYQDQATDHSSAVAQILEIETSLKKLGITLPS